MLNNRIDSLLAKRSNNSDIRNRVDSLLDKCNNTSTEKEDLILEKSDDIFDEFLGINDPVENIRNILILSESSNERLQELENKILQLNEALLNNKQSTHNKDINLNNIDYLNSLESKLKLNYEQRLKEKESALVKDLKLKMEKELSNQIDIIKKEHSNQISKLKLNYEQRLKERESALVKELKLKMEKELSNQINIIKKEHSNYLNTLRTQMSDICKKYEMTRFNGDNKANILYEQFIQTNNNVLTSKYSLIETLTKTLKENLLLEEDPREAFYTKAVIRSLTITNPYSIMSKRTSADELFNEYLLTLTRARNILNVALNDHPEPIISKLIFDVFPKISIVKSVNYNSTELKTFHQGLCKYIDYEIPFELLLELLTLMGFEIRQTKTGNYYANFSKNGDSFLLKYY